MRHARTIAWIWTAALLLSAAAVAGPSFKQVHLVAPAPSAQGAVDAVADALRAGDPARAIRVAGLALDRHDLSALGRTHVLLNRGLAREQLGDRRAAIGDFTEALRDTSLPAAERARALFDRGVVHDELGELDRALKDYSAALDLTPSFPAALNNRANVYRREGKLAEAQRDYEASIAAGNAEPQFANYGLGQIAEANGNPLAATRYYKKALEADPHYGLAKKRLAALGDVVTEAAYVPPPSENNTPVTQASYDTAADPNIPALRPAIIATVRSALRARVQLGAYRAEADAASNWNRLMHETGDLLTGLTPQIVSVDLPGRGRYWRLRAGPLDREAADALCRKLKARGLGCFPVKG